jgi:LAS superfamily LD-carboxypeptidase LdcB
MEKIFNELTGRTENHLIWSDELKGFFHKFGLKSFLDLKESASKEGFDLCFISSFRSYSRQEEIWNQKMRGQITVYDSQNNPLDVQTLEKRDLLFTVLKWSSIPGASRHHWGTDFDFIDKKALPKSYKIRLQPDEYEKGGIFYNLHLWLKEEAKKFGFFFPYQEDKGGIGAEPWHLSFYPQARKYQEKYTLDFFISNIEKGSMEGKEILFKEAPLIFRKFFTNISSFS